MTAIATEDMSGEGVMAKLVNARPRQRSMFKATARMCLLKLAGAIEQLTPADGLLLTFDDGPDPEVTPAVLELLAEFEAKALFFIVGNRIPRAPEMLTRICEAGHLIGNHTFAHPLECVPPLPAYFRDIKECQAVLESHTGKRPTLFRPPLGAITWGSLVAPSLLGLQTMLWSVDVCDWKLRCSEDARQAGCSLAEIANPGDVVLLHDDNPCVIPLLETALPQLCERRLELGMALGRISGRGTRANLFSAGKV